MTVRKSPYRLMDYFDYKRFFENQKYPISLMSQTGPDMNG